jgi:hypothetical protein
LKKYAPNIVEGVSRLREWFSSLWDFRSLRKLKFTFHYLTNID